MNEPLGSTELWFSDETGPDTPVSTVLDPATGLFLTVPFDDEVVR